MSSTLARVSRYAAGLACLAGLALGVAPWAVANFSSWELRVGDPSEWEGQPEIAIWKPTEWTTVVYESDLCFVMVTALDTLPESGTNEYDEGEAGGGPDVGEWHVVDFGSPSGYTSGGAVSGFTPARHISDDISGAAGGLDFYGTGCGFEGRQDPAASPVGQGPTGGNGPPSPRLLFNQIPGIVDATLTKVFIFVEYVLESVSMFGGEDWQNNNNGVKMLRILVDGCGNSPQGLIVDMLNGTIESQGCGTITATATGGTCTIHPANVWWRWPTHLGDSLNWGGNPCYARGDQGWTRGVTVHYWVCLDTDPDHNGNPSDGDFAVVSHGYDEPEGIMTYWTPADFRVTSNDAGNVTGVMNDNTWGGGGTRTHPFSKWLTYIKAWSGEGTGVSCTVPPIAPWT